MTSIAATSTGSLGKSAIYVGRKADLELPEALRRGEYCHLIGPRQIGKTSLCLRVARRLKSEGAACALLDLSAMHGAEDADGWYFAFADKLAHELGLSSPISWWDSPAVQRLPPVQRWTQYLRDVVLGEIEGRVVIFIDELQALPSGVTGAAPLAAIRALHEARNDDSNLTRLTFCLVGVVAPFDLEEDDRGGFFNVSREIRIEDFTRSEMALLRAALGGIDGDAHEVLNAIYNFTCGHPYMSMKLCAAVAKERPGEGEEGDCVGRLVHELFLERPAEDPCLNHALKGFTSRVGARGRYFAERLELYRQVLEAGELRVGNEDEVQLQLRLAGLVRSVGSKDGRHLIVRNPIFAQVFNEEWLRSQSRVRFFAEAMWEWLDSGRSNDALLRGTALERAVEWAKTGRLSSDERGFLDASVRAEHERTIADARRKRRYIIIISSLAAALAVAIGVVVANVARSELRAAREREQRAKQAKQEAEQMQTQVDARASEAEARSSQAQADVERAAKEAEAAKALAAEADAKIAAAKRDAALAATMQTQAQQKAAHALQDAAAQEAKAKKTVEAAQKEREELLRQAQELERMKAEGGESLKTLLASTQQRAANLASQVGRLEAEVDHLAREQQELLVCRLVVEAADQAGMQFWRARDDLQKLGRSVNAASLSRAIREANRRGALCPGHISWFKALDKVAEKLP